MNFVILQKILIIMHLLCSAAENDNKDAVGFFECTRIPTIERHESTNNITTEYESNNSVTSFPMQRTTQASFTNFDTPPSPHDQVEESTTKTMSESQSTPFMAASSSISEKLTETVTTCDRTSTPVAGLSTSVTDNLSAGFGGQSGTEVRPSASTYQTAEAENIEHSTLIEASSTKMPTSELEATTSATDTTTKTTASETTIMTTTPRETTTTEKCCTDCNQLYEAGYLIDGIYAITPSLWPGSPFEVFCKNGWTVIQRRVDGSVNFERNWDAYKEGFGSPDNELWIGNEKLFYLTNLTNYELQIDLIMSNSASKYLHYDLFRVSDEESNYRLSLGNYEGNAGKDFMGYHNNQFFTTFDRDNDGAGNENCAISHSAGWWYDFCYAANFNGDYSDAGNDGICVVDRTNFQYQCSIQYCEMKVRPLL